MAQISIRGRARPGCSPCYAAPIHKLAFAAVSVLIVIPRPCHRRRRQADAGLLCRRQVTRWGGEHRVPGAKAAGVLNSQSWGTPPARNASLARATLMCAWLRLPAGDI